MQSDKIFLFVLNNYLLTDTEVFTGKSQTEALFITASLRIEVNKLFLTWLKK